MKSTLKSAFFYIFCLSLLLGWQRIQAQDMTAGSITAQNLTIAQSAQFGTVLTGMQSDYIQMSGYTFNVAQPTESNMTEVMISGWVDGHYESQYVNEDVYDWVSGGYYRDVYTYGVISQEWVSPVYDEYGTEIVSGYYQDVYGDVWSGQEWVEEPYWGVVGTNSFMQEVWVDGYPTTWSEYVDDPIYGAPRLQFDASRSDANWVWRNPSSDGSGQHRDIMILWDGGLRIPGSNPNKMMTLSSESLIQSNQIQGTNAATTTHSSVKAESVGVTSNNVTNTQGGQIKIDESSTLTPKGLKVFEKTQEFGSSLYKETIITPTASSFGGSVQIQGALNILGGINLASVPIEEKFLSKTGTSISVGTGTLAGAAGIAMGQNAVASDGGISIGFSAGADQSAVGDKAVALGYESRAVGQHAVSAGKGSYALGLGSIAIGDGAKTLAEHSIAIGVGAEATLIGQLVLGSFNEPSPASDLVSSGDDLLLIGNGANEDERSNALVLKRNGDLHVKGAVLTVNNQVVLTANAASEMYFPLSRVNEFLTPNQAALLFQPREPEGAHYTLDNEVALMINQAVTASAETQRTLSNGLYLTESQVQAEYLTKLEASQIYALKEDLTALPTLPAGGEGGDEYLQKSHLVGLSYGESAAALPGNVALGEFASASGGNSSMAFGSHVVANNQGTHAIGTGVVANSPDQVVVGAFNDYGPDLVRSGTPDAEDPIFVVGNGSSGAAEDRSNAMVVKRNGDVEVGGVLRVQPAGNLSMGQFTTGPQP